MPAKHRQSWLSTNASYEHVSLGEYDDDEDSVEEGRYPRRHRRSSSHASYRPYKRQRQPSFSFTLFGIRRTCLWHRFTVRKFLYCLFIAPVILACNILLSGIPPSYKDIRAYERQLPQHNLTLAREAGHKYLRFRGSLWGHGLNNILQETILMSYLSFLTNRSFVFEDYVWSRLPFPYTIYDFALRPSRIPFNAFISGPTAGGPTSLAEDDPRRLAVSADFYASICPRSEVQLVSSHDAPRNADGESYIRWWADRLSTVKDVACVEIDAHEKQVFDLWLFGDKRIVTLWNGLSQSPVLKNFSWSHLVLSALLRNWHVLRPPSRQKLYESLFSPATRSPISNDPEPALHDNVTFALPGLPGVVAIHIRRGDYSRHCNRLAKYRSTYMGLNQFPSFIDVFDPDSYLHPTNRGVDDDAHEPPSIQKSVEDPSITDNQSYYMAHCYPTISQIAARLHRIRKDNPDLKRVYVLSNAWESWLKQLKLRLTKPSNSLSRTPSEGKEELGGWEEVITSYDLVLDSEQRYVDMAVDMAIAEQAEVFVGNGFSSASSNIVMLRMARGMDPRTNRFL